jgi:acyl carrier protein
MVKQSDGSAALLPISGPMEGTMDDIQTQIIELVAKSKNLPPESVTMESTFDELQIDSLDKINLSFAVEDMFTIEIPDESLNSLKTVGDVVRGVEQLRAAKSPDAAQT